jgi:hypothetical protein
MHLVFKSAWKHRTPLLPKLAWQEGSMATDVILEASRERRPAELMQVIRAEARMRRLQSIGN